LIVQPGTSIASIILSVSIGAIFGALFALFG